MAQLDAIALSEAVKRRLVDFVADDLFVRDPEIAARCRSLWGGPPETGGLVSDLWVEGAFPAKAATETLLDLGRRGVFDPGLAVHLDQCGAFPANRPLFQHQRDAVVAAGAPEASAHRPALIVTAGTGAGKTESFLLPILHDLWTQPRKPGEGVRCIILYPMNALVNDQVDRLYSWLKGQNRLSLFNFTSETPNNHDRAVRAGLAPGVWAPCRPRTRQEARGLETREGRTIDPAKEARGPVPDILITNYSMLEYMLCRPQDAVFFGPSLRAVVLDEAHLYTGTLAAEITLLLRRLYDRCGLTANEVMQVATSATIGSGDPDELRQFAQTLFSKDPAAVQVIQGQAADPTLPEAEAPTSPATSQAVAAASWPQTPTLELIETGETRLRTDAQACGALAEALSVVVSPTRIQVAQNACDQQPARLLAETLPASPIIQRMVEILAQEKRLQLRDLAVRLWGAGDKQGERATMRLLQLAAAGRPAVGDYPVLPHRLHVLARSADGMLVCLDSGCSGPEELKISGLGALTAGYQDRCPHCQGAAAALVRCDDCGDWALAATQAEGKLLPLRPTLYKEPSRALFFSTAPQMGASPVCVSKDGHISGSGGNGVPLWPIATCSACGLEAAKHLKPLFSRSASLPIAIVAETALAELPPLPADNNPWLPAQGRRLLAFSDSRREAAALGPRLTRQHEIHIVRAALAQCLRESPPVDELTLAEIRGDLQRLAQELAGGTLSHAQRMRRESDFERLRAELMEVEQGGSVESWVSSLKRLDVIAQLLDTKLGEKHHAETWTERAWSDNARGVKGTLEALVGRELAAPRRGAPSLETLGLTEITYPGLDTLQPPPELLGLLPTQQARQMVADHWEGILTCLLDSLRFDGVISLGSEELDAEFQSSRYLGRWSVRDGQSSWLVTFIGASSRQNRRWFACALLQKAGLAEAHADETGLLVLTHAFGQLASHAGTSLPWLEVSQKPVEGKPSTAIRLIFPRLGLRRPLSFYRCPTKGNFWTRHVAECVPVRGSDNLEAVTEDMLDRDPRYGRQRRELQESRVFKLALWAEEHSAQLDPRENRRLQDLFKGGLRNILSATTTLECGVDIGGLNAVLIGNVPPGKANYLQRAGRAGRRADGSSAVLTFSRSKPFDRAVFRNFGAYLTKSLRPPKVFLDRTRIVERHAHAALLGEFFRAVFDPNRKTGAMDAFGSIGVFCGLPLPPYWEARLPKPEVAAPILAGDRLTQQPWYREDSHRAGLGWYFLNFLAWAGGEGANDLQPRITRLLATTGAEPASLAWPQFLAGVATRFEEALGEWEREYMELLATWAAIDAPHGSVSQANAVRYQLKALYETTVIETLADRQFLPRYGFPISVMKLKVFVPDDSGREKKGRHREEDQFRLERSGLLALSEYVPGSRLLAGGRLITSRGLLKSWSNAGSNEAIGLRGQYAQCANDHFYYAVGGVEKCPICHEGPNRKGIRHLLMPKHGFSTAVWDPPRRSVEIERVGSVERGTVSFAGRYGDVSSILKVPGFAGVTGLDTWYREDGEILVYNEGEHDHGFAICLKCGYAESERQAGDRTTYLPRGFLDHAPLTQRDAWKRCIRKPEEAELLRNQALAARETTDVLMLDFSVALPFGPSAEGIAQTLARAFQIAGANLLELDTRELGVMIVPAGEGGRGAGIVVYDNVPGGAGHVRELLDLGATWLEEARQVLFVNPEHHARCDHMCLDCVLTFDAQESAHEGAYQRRNAIRLLDHLIGHRTMPVVEAPVGASAANAAGDPVQAKPSATARLERAAKRLQARDDQSRSTRVPASDPVLAKAYDAVRREAKQAKTLEHIEHLLDACLMKACPAPISGYEHPDARGHSIGMAELAWPTSRLALFLRNQAADHAAYERAGWHCWYTDELQDPAPLVERLKSEEAAR